VTATDEEAVAALERLARSEGIIAALESAHAIAHAIRVAPTMPRNRTILVNLSGRGDKDMGTIAEVRGVKLDGDAAAEGGGTRGAIG